MKVRRAIQNPLFVFGARMLLLIVLALFVKAPAARAELQWEANQREQLRLRIVALAASYPRSSVFSTDEVFIAEMQISHDESRLVKLIYAFLPYQPRLSEYGLDYALVHELTALRDPSCDESLHELMTVQKSDGSVERNDVKYSTDSPVLDMKHERGILHCYRTTPEEYAKAIHDPVQHPQFSLKLRK